MDGSLSPIEQLAQDEFNRFPRERWFHSDGTRKDSDILTIAATIGARTLPDGRRAGDVYNLDERKIIVRQLYPTG
jgi:hypothetical protein